MQNVILKKPKEDAEDSAGIPRIVLPLTGRTRQELFLQLSDVAAAAPDLVEWRADCFENGKDPDAASAMAAEIRRALGGIPLLFTFRSAGEGGMQKITPADYAALNLAVINSGAADAVDTEIRMDNAAVEEILPAAHKKEIAVIASCHDFTRTPADEEMLALFLAMYRSHADILKLAVMPQSPDDVKRLLKVTALAAEGGYLSEYLKSGVSAPAAPFGEDSACDLPPVVTMSMGEMGRISRITGELTGSCMTFGTAGASSAPGQIPVPALRSALLAVHRHLRAGNIALIGFMGSGKSTVGRALSGLFGLAFAETDAMIEEAAGMPIPEIFSRFGEAHFRELESRCIAQAAAMSGTVISCGGGAVLRRENVDALRKNSLPVLLTASPATILARTQADTSRPLLSGKKTAADIEGLIAARQSAYDSRQEWS